MEGEVLDVEGKVLVMHRANREFPVEMARKIAALKPLAVIVLGPGETIEALGEREMRVAGWCRCG